MVVPHGRADRRRSCVRSRSVTCPGGSKPGLQIGLHHEGRMTLVARCKRDSFTQPRYPFDGTTT